MKSELEYSPEVIDWGHVVAVIQRHRLQETGKRPGSLQALNIESFF